MPSSKPSSSSPSRLQDSWTPAKLLLQPTLPHQNDAEIENLDLDLAKMDEDPLIYFLTPTPSYPDDDGDVMDFDVEFDAGIEDAKHPPQIVRSVSPSSLGGLSRPPPLTSAPRPPTPPRSPATPDLEFDLGGTPDERDDEYLHARLGGSGSASAFGIPRRLRNLAGGKPKALHPENNTTLFLPPTSPYHSPSHSPSGSPPRSPPHSPSTRGRATTRLGHPTTPQQQRSARVAAGLGGAGASIAPPARLSPHAWREPSPDVWAIEEETEEDLRRGGGIVAADNSTHGETGVGTRAVDIPAAKPQRKNKKRVRFVLPA